MRLLRRPSFFIASILIPAILSATARAGQTPLTTTRIATGLTSPIYVTHLAGDYDRLFIVEQCGRVKIFKNGAVQSQLFLDLSTKVSCSGERGLLGLAFHPEYDGDANKQFFVNYTDTIGRTVVARYSVSSNPDVADTTEEILIRIDQPFANHNGGWIDFGVDGYLYVATGDGGDGNDPGNRAQTITDQLLGKILRIDVDGDDFPGDALRNYAIPSGNPFVGVTGDDEIWAYGLRNPWRCSFDRQTHDLYIGDVGQDALEEVDFQPAADAGGRNYGWRCMEGTDCTGLTGCTCDDPSLTFPIHEYSHSGFQNSITGGYVYRGCTIPDLQGTYFFADFGRNRIWSLRYDGAAVSEFQERTTELEPPVGSIASVSSFGEDAYGELYITDLFGGEVFKLVPDVAIADCNSNQIADACDIASGQSPDQNGDDVPDECQPVPAVSTWGLAALVLLIAAAGSVVLARRPPSGLGSSG